MSFAYIKSKFEALGPVTTTTVVTIDQTFSGSTALIAILEDSLGLSSIDFRAEECHIDTDLIVLRGRVDLLEFTNWEFDLRIRPLEDEYSFVIQLRVPTGFKWWMAFPGMEMFPDSSPDSKDLECLMDAFTLRTSYFYCSNTAYEDTEWGVSLVQGLSFAGELGLGGPFKNISYVFQDVDAAFYFAGPVKECLPGSAPGRFTGLRLSADVPLTADFGSVEVEKTEMLVKSPMRSSDLDFQYGFMAEPGIYFVAHLKIDGRPALVLANYDPADTSTFTFRGMLSEFALSNLSTLDGTVGGPGLATSTPSDLSEPSGIMLTEVGFTLDLETKKVIEFVVGIGCSDNWTLVPDWLALTQMGMRFTIDQPFTSARSFELGLIGKLNVGGVLLEAEVRYPSKYFMLQLDPDSDLRIGDLISTAAPGIGSLPDLSVETLRFEGSVATRSALIAGRFTELGAIPLGNTTLNFDELHFVFDYHKGGGSSGYLEGTASIGEAVAHISASVSQQTILTGHFSNINLHQFYKDISGETTVPDEVPDLTFEQVTITYNLTTKSFLLVGSADFAYTALPANDSITAHIEFRVERTGTDASPSAYNISLSLSGTGPVEIAEGFDLEALTLLFNYNTTAGWSLSGTLNTDILGTKLALAATYVKAGFTTTLTLSAISTDYVNLFNIADVLALGWKRLDMSLATTVANNTSTKAWALRIDAKLTVAGASGLEGYLELYSQGEKKGLRLKTNATNYEKAGLDNVVSLEYLIKELAFLKDSSTTPWKMIGSAMFRLKGVPGKVGQLMSEGVTATMTLSKDVTKLEILNPMAPWKFPLPKADGKDLGTMVLQLRSIGVSLRPTLGLTSQLAVGFPKELNEYFKSAVFREYQEGSIMSMALLECTLRAAGVNLKFINSPFQSANANKVSGEDWINFDFGDNGEIAMKMPSFRYDYTSSYFEASGGFKIVRPLSVPLSPLLNYLEDVGFSSAKSIFPDKLPIKGFSIVDSENNLKTEELINFLGDVPEQAKTALRQAGNLFNRFPDGFKSYLKFEIPTELGFKFGFSPLGRVALSLLAPAEPIRFMFPGVVPGLIPMSGLIGLEMRKLTVGTLASGTLFYGEVDAILDFYDLPGLIASLALPTHAGFPLPTSDELQRRVSLRNVFSIIPLTQGLPVPVPIFYDDIGLDYMGLEGFGIGVHLGVPQPDFAAGGVALIQALGDFFKSRTSRLDPNSPPGGQEIKFVFHDEYLQAPEYLGDGMVGSKGITTEIGTWKYVAQMLNFMKKFGLDDFINAMKVEYRVGNGTTKLACFDLEGQFLLTTPHEFGSGAYTQLGLTATQLNDFKEVLPAVQTNTNGVGNGSAGIIFFMRGAVKASSYFDLKASLGMAVSGPVGFNTGFKFDGKIGTFVQAELKGALLINSPYVTPTSPYPAATPVAGSLPAPIAKRGDGQCLSLDGTKSYATIDLSGEAAIPQFTIEFWALVEKVETGATFFSGGSGKYSMEAVSQGIIRCSYMDGTTSKRLIAGQQVYSLNTWHHYALVYNGSNLKIMINGVSKANVAVSNAAFKAGSYTFGKLPVGTIGMLTGKMTELRIWKRARTPEEIVGNMYARLKGNENNLLHLFPLDADNGTVAFNACSGKAGVLTACTYTPINLALQTPVWLDGVTDRIVIPVYPGFKRAAFTVRLNCFISSSQAGTATIIAAANGAFTVQTNQAGLIKDEWITLTIVGNGTQLLTYVNEKQVGTQTVTASSAVETTAITIGESSNATAAYLKGAVSELSIWTVAQSAAWILATQDSVFDSKSTGIQSLYRFAKAESGLVHSYTTDRPARVEVRAIDGNAKPTGLQFANSKLARVPPSSRFSMEAFTIECWIKPDSVGTQSVSIVRLENGNGEINWTGGKITFRWRTSAGTNVDVSTQLLLPLGQWSHVAVTYSKMVGKVYLNGLKASEKTATSAMSPSTSAFLVGRATLQTVPSFLGSIDAVRVWNRELDAREIKRYKSKEIYGNEPNLVAWYNFDSQTNEQLVDSGPNSLHGKLVGFNLPENLAAKASDTRYLIQAYGHAYLQIGGRDILLADLVITDNSFYFKGKLNLFPAFSPLKVVGDAMGLITKESLRLECRTDVQLYSLVLSRTYVLVTHSLIHLESQYLGEKLILDVTWAGNNPTLKGSIIVNYSGKFEFGRVYINGIRVSDNLKLQMSIAYDIQLSISKDALAFVANAAFTLQGKSFSLSISLNYAPADVIALANLVREAIAKDAANYLSHIFGSAVGYATAVVNDVIETLDDSLQLAGNNLVQIYNLTTDAAAQAWHDAGGVANDAAAIVSNAYQVSSAELATALNKCGYVLDDIAKALDSVGISLTDIAKDIAGFSTDAAKVVVAVVNIGKPIANAINAFGAINFPVEQVGKALITDLGKSVSDSADLLKGAYTELRLVANGLMFPTNGDFNKVFSELDDIFPRQDITNLLRGGYQKNAMFIAQLYKGFGYTAEDSFELLRVAFNDGKQLIVNTFRDMGHTCDQLASILTRYSNVDAKAAAQMLKNAGFSCSDITSSLKSYYGKSKDACKDILKSIGFTDSVINSALSNWF